MNLDFKSITDAQYQLLAERRQNYDNMLWQTPVISLTAQAFLFTIALGGGERSSRILAGMLSFFAAVAASQLMSKHRYFEVYYSKLLEKFEAEKGMQPIHQRPAQPEGSLGLSSYRVWQMLFLIFAVIAIMAGLT
jgi:hypothetical protein